MIKYSVFKEQSYSFCAIAKHSDFKKTNELQSTSLEDGSSSPLISQFFVLKNKPEKLIYILRVAGGMMLSVKSWEVPYLSRES